MSDVQVRRAASRQPAAQSQWLPVASVAAAVLFSFGVLLLARAVLRHDHAPGATFSTAVSPVAEGRVSVRQAGPVREYTMLSPHSGLMMPAVAPDGHVWVGEMDSNRLAELDPSSGEMREYALPGATAAGIMGTTIDGQGGVWYSEASRGAIGVLETGTRTFSEFSTGDPTSSPSGIAVDAAGNVWFTELSGAIAEFDVHTAQMRQFRVPTEGSAPYALAVDAQGTVWFTEFGAAKIGRLDPSTGSFQEWATPSRDSGPAGIAIGPEGSLWFSESNANALGLLSAGADQVREIPLPGSRRPSGIALAPNGNVWLSDTSGSVISVYDPAGATFRSITLPTPQAGVFWFAAGPSNTLWAVEGALDANKLAAIDLEASP